MEDPATPEHLFFPGFGTVTTCWHFINPDPQLQSKTAHKVYLRHNQYTGAWTLFMDGKKVREAGASDYANGRSTQISFTVDSSDAEIVIEHSLSSLKYNYTLLVASQPVKDVSAAAEELTHADLLPAQVTITGTRSVPSGRKVVTYYMCETRLHNGQTARMERRYREFEQLDSLLKSALSGSHLLPSFPNLPGRVLNPFLDQTSAEFIQDRQHHLEVYLRALINMSKIRTNPDLLVFLGLNPTTGLPVGARPSSETKNEV